MHFDFLVSDKGIPVRVRKEEVEYGQAYSERLLHAVTLDLVSIRQGGADVFRNACVTDLCCSIRQNTGNREALVAKKKKKKQKGGKRKQNKPWSGSG